MEDAHDNEAKGRRLGSLKEIADYVGVSSRTIQNWTRHRGFPLVRDGNGQRPRVAAYTGDIDSWRVRQDMRAAADSTTIGSVPSPGSEPMETARPLPNSAPRSRRSPAAILTFLAAATASGFVGVWVLGQVRPQPYDARVESSQLVVFDAEGEETWRVPYPGLRDGDYVNHEQDPQHYGELIMVTDVDGDGRNEVLLVRRDEREEVSDRLLCLDSGGELRWQATFGGPEQIRGRLFPSDYSVVVNHIVELGSGRAIVVTSSNHFYPTEVRLIAGRTGATIDSYWHPGHFYDSTLFDLDGDGRVELLLGGTNNPDEGPGHAVLGALKLPFETRPDVPGFFGAGSAREFRYVVFARPDFVTAGQFGHYGHSIRSVTINEAGVIVAKTSDPPLYHYLTRTFDPVDLQAADEVKKYHDKLFREGLLDHALGEAVEPQWRRVVSFDTAPDGNAPEVTARIDGK